MTRLEAAVAELVDALRAELAPVADPPERLLSIPDAAEALGRVARSTVYREMQAGRLRSVRVGGRRMIPQSAIDAYAAGGSGRP